MKDAELLQQTENWDVEVIRSTNDNQSVGTTQGQIRKSINQTLNINHVQIGDS